MARETINFTLIKTMKQLHPRAVWFFFFSSLYRWFFIFLFFGVFFINTLLKFNKSIEIAGFAGLLLIVVLVLIILLYIWAKLSYNFYRYELMEDGFRKEMGVITKKYVTIPYDRIQNVDIYRGILARILGLSDLNIQTAGASAQVSRSGVFGAHSEGRLPALSREEAEQIRDELIRRAKQSKNQGL